MLLRASGEREGTEFDLEPINGGAGDANVPGGAWLLRLTDLSIGSRWDDLPDVLEDAAQAIGQRAAVDALVVAAAFNGITRVADCTGIPLDETTAEATVGLREALALDDFQYAAKSRRFD